MLTGIDIFAIVLLESFGIVSFLLAVVFFKQSRKISDKRESLKKATTDEIRNGPCYSYKWAMRSSMKRKKVLGLYPALAAFIQFLVTVMYWYVGPHILAALIRLGYVPLVVLIGVAILLFQEDAFEAYSYSKAIQKVAPDHLSLEDEGYMELAEEALEKAITRFFMIGIIFILIGPFISQIVEGLIYAFVMYTRIIFQVSGESSTIPAFAIAAGLTLVLLLLPAFMGRTIFQKLKLLAQTIRKLWKKR